MKKIKDVLIEKGFVEGVDFTLTEKTLTALERSRVIIPGSPEVKDEAGNVITPAVPDTLEKWTPILPEVQSLMSECLRSVDTGLMINKYLEANKHLRDPDDNLNLDLYLQTGSGWRFKNIPAPTLEIIYDMAESTLLEAEQARVNAEVEAFLKETDWLVIREIETGVKMDLVIKAKRAEMRLKHKKAKA